MSGHSLGEGAPEGVRPLQPLVPAPTFVQSAKGQTNRSDSSGMVHATGLEDDVDMAFMLSKASSFLEMLKGDAESWEAAADRLCQAEENSESRCPSLQSQLEEAKAELLSTRAELDLLKSSAAGNAINEMPTVALGSATLTSPSLSAQSMQSVSTIVNLFKSELSETLQNSGISHQEALDTALLQPSNDLERRLSNMVEVLVEHTSQAEISRLRRQLNEEQRKLIRINAVNADLVFENEALKSEGARLLCTPSSGDSPSNPGLLSPSGEQGTGTSRAPRSSHAPGSAADIARLKRSEASLESTNKMVQRTALMLNANDSERQEYVSQQNEGSGMPNVLPYRKSIMASLREGSQSARQDLPPSSMPRKNSMQRSSGFETDRGSGAHPRFSQLEHTPLSARSNSSAQDAGSYGGSATKAVDRDSTAGLLGLVSSFFGMGSSTASAKVSKKVERKEAAQQAKQAAAVSYVQTRPLSSAASVSSVDAQPAISRQNSLNVTSIDNQSNYAKDLFGTKTNEVSSRPSFVPKLQLNKVVGQAVTQENFNQNTGVPSLSSRSTSSLSSASVEGLEEQQYFLQGHKDGVQISGRSTTKSPDDLVDEVRRTVDRAVNHAHANEQRKRAMAKPLEGSSLFVAHDDSKSRLQRAREASQRLPMTQFWSNLASEEPNASPKRRRQRAPL